MKVYKVWSVEQWDWRFFIEKLKFKRENLYFEGFVVLVGVEKLMLWL